ncbi:AFG1/ZapE family ATPase [Glutamicibacter sp. M10]|uniref:AFG1/ZapE family ATPase n=1 Tax=Glutamicibacter sp. M10 TaxID=3023076 RepID=UPI0037BE992F
MGRFIHADTSNDRQGVYIYGPPGRGKTLITNTFVALQSSRTTKRFHFHEFFQKLNSRSIESRVSRWEPSSHKDSSEN